jgi:serine O-acetyltransferase
VEAICAYTADFGLAARDAIVVRQVAELPTTATGKLQRTLLAQNLADTPQVPTTPDAPAMPPASFTHLLEQLFGARLNLEATFAALSGDSLIHMQVALALEHTLGTLPAEWEYTPLGTLAARVDGAGDFQALMASDEGAPPLPDGSTNQNPPDISFLKLVAEDYRTNDSSIFHQGFVMLLMHRLGNLRMDIRWKSLRIVPTLLCRLFNKLTQILFGMKLDYTVKVGRRVKLEHFGGMILGAREIGSDVWIRQNTTFGIRSVDDVRAKPVIGNFVDIGAGAVIVGNITIGDNSIIGANTVVFSNVPPNSIVIGVPGKVIGLNARQNRSPLSQYPE